MKLETENRILKFLFFIILVFTGVFLFLAIYARVTGFNIASVVYLDYTFTTIMFLLIIRVLMYQIAISQNL